VKGKAAGDRGLLNENLGKICSVSLIDVMSVAGHEQRFLGVGFVSGERGQEYEPAERFQQVSVRTMSRRI
jgi:hypothetical protein